METLTHLHDAAQVLHVHALRLDDLHDHPVHVGQLGIGRHGVRDDRGGLDVRDFAAADLPVAGSNVVVPLVFNATGVQLRLPAAPGTSECWTLLPGLLCGALSWAQLQVYVLLALCGRSGGGRKGSSAPEKAAAISGRARRQGGHQAYRTLIVPIYRLRARPTATLGPRVIVRQVRLAAGEG